MADSPTVVVMGAEERPAAATAPASTTQGLSTDHQLVAAVLRKDRKATAEFISQYADAIYGYVRHRLSPRAHLVDDVVQDVFVAALAGLASFRGTSPLRSWLLGIARHKVEDVYRAQLREPESLDDSDGVEPAADGPAIEETIDRERVEARTQNVLR